MIELLLQAERALAVGLVDQAERLYRQAADVDPKNSIAVVGLARVALERGDEREAWRQARRALEIDPENVAARRLAGRLEEVYAFRGESLPELAGGSASDAVGVGGAPGATPTDIPPAAPASSSPIAAPSTTAGSPAQPSAAPPASTRDVITRLFRRYRP